jgi:farnesyl-diphosphate farnesyltransferase
MIALEATESVESWSGKDRDAENFPVGSVLISRRLRPHVHAFYAFARNADDIADSPVLASDDKLARLDAMGRALDGLDGHRAPTARTLRESLAATGVTAAHSHELLDAFRQDAVKSRYADWGELLAYCRLSAMPVGRHVLDLHGEARDTWEPSDALCASLQVLNHLQDCARDLAELDRCYLPADWLREAGADLDELRAPTTSAALRRVLDRLLDECDALNLIADGLPRRVRDRRLRMETSVIVQLAARLARRLREGDPLAHRVKLTRGDGVASVIGALRFLA